MVAPSFKICAGLRCMIAVAFAVVSEPERLFGCLFGSSTATRNFVFDASSSKAHSERRMRVISGGDATCHSAARLYCEDQPHFRNVLSIPRLHPHSLPSPLNWLFYIEPTKLFGPFCLQSRNHQAHNSCSALELAECVLPRRRGEKRRNHDYI
ncbi:hypothetical protein C8J56DRAFT_525289 [Mycena floridula]|nr:hypothetical protein C8J56DRAFT_525289 [Mycena floridula]